MKIWIDVLIKSLLAVVIGGLIGSERARHGRAAGMRTHVLVCLGSCLTSMTGLYVSNVLGNTGDVFRIAAQVISGVGFLGAGMIILKNNNVITGLTTAAGVWATGAIGIAVGFGFYSGAIISTLLFLATIILFAKFEKKKKSTQIIYLEIDDMRRTNKIVKEISETIKEPFTFNVIPPKSETQEHLGINIIIEKRIEFDIAELCNIENIIYAVEDI